MMFTTESDFYVYIGGEDFLDWFVDNAGKRNRCWQLEPPIRISPDLAEIMYATPNIDQHLLPHCWNQISNRLGYLMAKLLLVDAELPELTMAVDRKVWESVNNESTDTKQELP